MPSRPHASHFKLRIVAILLFPLIGAGSSATAQTESEATLTIRVTGLSPEEGQVRIAVFNSKDSWLREPAFGRILDVEGPAVTWTVEQVPYGDYGIATFHDKNENGKNDLNFFKKPKEPYGFSNNARRVLGPARWDQVKFTVANPIQTTEILVK